MKMEVSAGVLALLLNTQKPISEGEKYFFEGDLCQRSEAMNVALKLDIEVGIGGGLPYVHSKEDFDKVVEYIIDHHVEGYWHYAKKNG